MDRSLINTLVEAIRKADARKTQPYDTQATVTRVENGIAWVHIPGGVDETPVRLTVDAKKGDTVQVRISGGRAHLTGNATAPPTDDTKANKVGANLAATQKVVKAVKATAEKASRIATSTAQYFWVSTGGTDNGAHITAIPQEEFEADPQNGGGNTLMTTNGVAVRDGLTELASFASDGIRIDEAELVYDPQTGQQSIVSKRAALMGRDDFDSSTETSVWAMNDCVLENNGSTVADAQAGTIISYSPTQDTMHAQTQLLADLSGSGGKKAQVLVSSTIINYSGTRTLVSIITLAADMVRFLSGNTAVAPIVQDKFSALDLSASTYYVQRNFTITKSGYTPIAFNPYTNHATEAACMVNYNSSTGIATVTVMSRNSTISGLNLYLDVTYARSELL